MEALTETNDVFRAVVYAAPDVILSTRLPHAASLGELEKLIAGSPA
jgi:hypothetical protein